MTLWPKYIPLFVFPLFVLGTTGCGNNEKPPEKDLVKNAAQLERRVPDYIQQLLKYALASNGSINDSVRLKALPLVKLFYESNDFEPVWCMEESWKPEADSLFRILAHVKEYGLFPSDYALPTLTIIRNQIERDSLSRKDAALWTRADILLTESYFTLARELKLGRLERDSTTLRNDSLLNDDFFVNHFKKALSEKKIISSLEQLEPQYEAYKKIKAAIIPFLSQDTLPLSVNDSSLSKFRRIAITLDRYKQLPDSLPKTYIWVNIPSFTLSLYDADSIALQSKVIVGNPATRTPLLNSEVTNFITYPQWTVPYSIIFKEMLPKIRQNISYLTKQNLMIVDKNDSVVDPARINWEKINKQYFPYLIRQRQGDDNSLGVIKFNFRNKYSVYLHDTNARWLFSKSERALSHGCVRVQQWEKLSHFLVKEDTIRYHVDTLKAWISRGEKHLVSGFPRVPVFIRYFTVEGKSDGTLKFFKDVYKEDSILNAKYFVKRR